MQRPFRDLEERLLREGVSPRHVRRYVAELRDHLADLRAEEEMAGRQSREAEAAAVARLGSEEDLADAILRRPELRSWTARVPWVVFGVGALGVLAVAYAVALLILWSGWRIFLPESATPFVRVDGPAVPYFGLGRMIYYGAPLFVSWGLEVIAARQRVAVMWPIMGVVLVCLAGAMAHVRVWAVGSVGMAIAPVSVTYLAALVVLSLLPYLAWRGEAAFRRV